MRNILKEELALIKAIKEADEYKKMSPEMKKEFDRKSLEFKIPETQSTYTALASLF